jgi:DNA-binding transcriptional MerR regulator
MNKNEYVDRAEVERSVFLKNRALEFYLRQGLIKKGERIDKNDRRVFWRRDYIFDELKAIDFLSDFELLLTDIANLAKKTDHGLREIVLDLQIIIEQYLALKKQEYKVYDIDALLTYKDANKVVERYCKLVYEKGVLPTESAIKDFNSKMSDLVKKEVEHEAVIRAVTNPEDDSYMKKVSKKIIDDHKKEIGI